MLYHCYKRLYHLSTQTAQIDRSTPGGDGIDRSCGLNYQTKIMTPKQQAAKDRINKLAIELIARVNQQPPLTEFDVSKIRDISNEINYEINDLNNYEELERMFAQ